MYFFNPVPIAFTLALCLTGCGNPQSPVADTGNHVPPNPETPSTGSAGSPPDPVEPDTGAAVGPEVELSAASITADTSAHALHVLLVNQAIESISTAVPRIASSYNAGNHACEGGGSFSLFPLVGEDGVEINDDSALLLFSNCVLSDSDPTTLTGSATVKVTSESLIGRALTLDLDELLLGDSVNTTSFTGLVSVQESINGFEGGASTLTVVLDETAWSLSGLAYSREVSSGAERSYSINYSVALSDNSSPSVVNSSDDLLGENVSCPGTGSISATIPGSETLQIAANGPASLSVTGSSAAFNCSMIAGFDVDEQTLGADPLRPPPVPDIN